MNKAIFLHGSNIESVSVSSHNEIGIDKDGWDNICTKVKLIHFSDFQDYNGVFLGLLIPAILQTIRDFCKTLSFDILDIVFTVLIIVVWMAYRYQLSKGKYKPTDNIANKIHVDDLIMWTEKYSNRYINKTKPTNTHYD